MIQARLIGLLTEIYVGGGNSWLTENFPTNFHTFCKRKVLTGGDSAENYREVTDAEKAAIEKADAKWVKPPQWVIDTYNEHCKCYTSGRNVPISLGGYNENTGYFEYDEFKDIGAEEATEMIINGTPQGGNVSHWLSGYAARASMPLRCFAFAGSSSHHYKSNLFAYGSNIEIATVFHTHRGIYNGYFTPNSDGLDPVFSACGKLRKILGSIDMGRFKDAAKPIDKCPNLEYVCLTNIKSTVDLSMCPKLTYESMFDTVAEHSAERAHGNISGIITLHPEAYARLTDELLAKAADKNITFATTD